jgi:alanyl-tRNA synthetase
MGISERVLGATCATVIDVMGAAYPQLERDRPRILAEVQAEEAKFDRTLEAGTQRLADLVKTAGEGGTISGADAFRLHDTFGFPIDLTVEMAAEAGVAVDRAGFETEMAAQRDRSRGARAARFTPDPFLNGLVSEFIGYPNETSGEGSVLAVAGDAGAAQVVLDRSPFYAEGGGQIGDRGRLVGAQGSLEVTDTQRFGEAIVHLGQLSGSLSVGEAIHADVDVERRWGAARNHTATHLLHRALRDVLGEQARQSGSWVGPDALRFDFPAAGPTSREDLRAIELAVNARIRDDLLVTPAWVPFSEAQAAGADMFFGEKYAPESVRMVTCGAFSRELCGGTHVAATGQIGSLRILGEASIGTGLRRIEAVTGAAADALVADRLDALHRTATLLGDREENVPARVEALLARVKEAERGARDGSGSSNPALDAAGAIHEGTEVGDAALIVGRYAEADAGALRGWVDAIRASAGRFVAVGAGIAADQATIVIAASRDLTAEGFDAVLIARAVAGLIGGGGGGRADLAQAGGRNVAGLDEALAEARRLASEAILALEPE